MSALPKTFVSIEEYLALEASAESRHEYIGGEIVAMTGASIVHNQIKQNISRFFDDPLDAQGCNQMGDPVAAEAGFCRVASLDEVRGHDYKLTPGIYVGTAAAEADDELFEEKMPRLIGELRGLFAQSDQLQREILADLEGLGI